MCECVHGCAYLSQIFSVSEGLVWPFVWFYEHVLRVCVCVLTIREETDRMDFLFEQ